MTAVGDRVEFLGFGDPDPYSALMPGTLGTVTHVDDAGTIHVDWDNGAKIGLVTRPFGDYGPRFKPDRYRQVPA